MMIMLARIILTAVMILDINNVLTLQTSKPTCLTNLHISGQSPTSLSVEWKYLQNDHCSIQNVKEFKIYYSHQGYLACGGGTRQGSGEKVISVKQSETVNLVGLEPFSVYSIEVKALHKISSRKVRGKTVRKRPEILKIDVIQTEKALPEVKLRLPRNSVFKTDCSLTFTWTKPSMSDCQAFHTNLGGYYYILEEEGHSQNLAGNISIDQPSVKFSNLEPFTNYKLNVYIIDEDGAYDPNNVLVLSASTEPSSPPPPTQLKVTAQDGQYFVTWNPPTPPKGMIDKYHLQLKLESQSKWVISEYRRPPWNLGPNGEVSHILNTHINNNANYTFKVQAFNEGVSQPSPWSDPITVSTISFFSTSPNTTIAIILILFIIIFLSVFLILFIWKKRHRLSSFRFVPSHDNFVTTNPNAIPSPKGGHQQDEEYEAPILRTKQNNYVTEPHQTNNGNIYVDMEKPNHKSMDPPKHESSEKPIRRRSCLDPLPAVPGENEPVYYNVRDDNVSNHPNPGLEHSTERTYDLGSVESLDSEGYLKPNYMR